MITKFNIRINNPNFVLLLKLLVVFQLSTIVSCKDQKSIIDEVGFLDWNTTSKVDSLITSFRKKTSCEILLIVDSSIPNGNDVKDYSLKLFDKYKVGKNKVNNGVLIFVSKKDKKIAVQVGYGMEWLITQPSLDSIVKQMIHDFENRDFNLGIYRAVEHIINLTHDYNWHIKDFDDARVKKNDVIKINDFRIDQEIQPYVIRLKKDSFVIKLHYTKYMSNLIAAINKKAPNISVYFRTITSNKIEGELIGVDY